MDITEVANRLAIAETLALYCRGIDRCANRWRRLFPGTREAEQGGETQR